MPCNCDHLEPSQYEAESRRVRKFLKYLGIPRSDDYYGHTADWWEEHQRVDRERVASERKARAAHDLRTKTLRKLSRQEKEALGL